MSEVSVRAARGLCVVVSFPGGEQPLAITQPHDLYARLDLVYVRPGEIGVMIGTPSPPPLRAPEPPEGAAAVAAVMVRPVYIASSDIIAAKDLDPGR